MRLNVLKREERPVRQRLQHVTPAELKVAPGAPQDIFGIVMETGMDEAVATFGLLQSAGNLTGVPHQHGSDAVAARHDREERLRALQRRAQARIDDERVVFSVAQLADIEARYASARTPTGSCSVEPGAGEILLDLVRRYPRSTAGLRAARLRTDVHRCSLSCVSRETVN